MVHPFAGDHQPFTHGRQRNGADHGDGLVTAAAQPQNGIAVFIVLIDDGADGTLDDLQFLFHTAVPP